MKKFWIVKFDKYFKDSLKYLGVDNYFINTITDSENQPNDYIKMSKYNCFYISYDSNDRKFGWDRIENYSFFRNNKYEYCGTINLRKEKLKKLQNYK